LKEKTQKVIIIHLFAFGHQMKSIIIIETVLLRSIMILSDVQRFI
jgi:hypothetical protein